MGSGAESELLHSNLLCSYTSSCATATTSSCPLMLQHPVGGPLAQETYSCSPWALVCSFSFWQQQLSLVFQGLPNCCCEGRRGSKAGTVAITEEEEKVDFWSELTPETCVRGQGQHINLSGCNSRTIFSWDCANRRKVWLLWQRFSNSFPYIVWKEPCGNFHRLQSGWLVGPHASAI